MDLSVNQTNFTSFLINDILRSSKGRNSIKRNKIPPSLGQIDLRRNLSSETDLFQNSFIPSSLSRGVGLSSPPPLSGHSCESSFRFNGSFSSSVSSSPTFDYWKYSRKKEEVKNQSVPSSISQGSLNLSDRFEDDGNIQKFSDNGMGPVKETNHLWKMNPMIQTLFWHNLLVRRKEILSSCRSRKGGQIRFTHDQTAILEKRFLKSKYLAPSERKRLSKQIRLTERQVKTWFQNRRAKCRRTKVTSTSLVNVVGIEQNFQKSSETNRISCFNDTHSEIFL